MTNPNRVKKGIPTGGQFDERRTPEANVSLRGVNTGTYRDHEAWTDGGCQGQSPLTSEVDRGGSAVFQFADMRSACNGNPLLRERRLQVAGDLYRAVAEETEALYADFPANEYSDQVIKMAKAAQATADRLRTESA